MSYIYLAGAALIVLSVSFIAFRNRFFAAGYVSARGTVKRVHGRLIKEVVGMSFADAAGHVKRSILNHVAKPKIVKAAEGDIAQLEGEEASIKRELEEREKQIEDERVGSKQEAMTVSAVAKSSDEQEMGHVLAEMDTVSKQQEIERNAWQSARQRLATIKQSVESLMNARINESKSRDAKRIDGAADSLRSSMSGMRDVIALWPFVPLAALMALDYNIGLVFNLGSLSPFAGDDEKKAAVVFTMLALGLCTAFWEVWRRGIEANGSKKMVIRYEAKFATIGLVNLAVYFLARNGPPVFKPLLIPSAALLFLLTGSVCSSLIAAVKWAKIGLFFQSLVGCVWLPIAWLWYKSVALKNCAFCVHKRAGASVDTSELSREQESLLTIERNLMKLSNKMSVLESSRLSIQGRIRDSLAEVLQTIDAQQDAKVTEVQRVAAESVRQLQTEILAIKNDRRISQFLAGVDFAISRHFDYGTDDVVIVESIGKSELTTEKYGETVVEFQS